MRKIGLAAAIASASVLSAGAATAASVDFYLGTTKNKYYTPSCERPSGHPAVSQCESHGLKLDVKGYTVNQHTYTPGRQLSTKSLGHDGLGVKAGWWDLDPNIDGNLFTADEALVLHFDHRVKLTKLGFSRVGRKDDVMIGVLQDLDSAVSHGYEFDLRDDGTNSKGEYNGRSSYKWISLPGLGDQTELHGSLFLISTTDKKDSFGLKYVHAEKVPLPAAGWMLIAGVGGLVAMKRRARKKS